MSDVIVIVILAGSSASRKDDVSWRLSSRVCSIYLVISSVGK